MSTSRKRMTPSLRSPGARKTLLDQYSVPNIRQSGSSQAAVVRGELTREVEVLSSPQEVLETTPLNTTADLRDLELSAGCRYA